MHVLAGVVEGGFSFEGFGNAVFSGVAVVHDANNNVREFGFDSSKLRDLIIGWIAVADRFECFTEFGVDECDDFAFVSYVDPPAFGNGGLMHVVCFGVVCFDEVHNGFTMWLIDCLGGSTAAVYGEQVIVNVEIELDEVGERVGCVGAREFF